MLIIIPGIEQLLMLFPKHVVKTKASIAITVIKKIRSRRIVISYNIYFIGLDIF